MRIAIPVLLILVFAAACSGGDKNSDEADDSPTTDAVAEPTATSTEDAASPTPTEAAGVRAEAAMYIDGGGSGVAIRDACEDTARTGDAWPDGTKVAVVQVGAGTCEGWSLMLAGKGSWVRDEYLTDEKPATVATRPSSGTGTQPSPTNGGGTQPKPAATSAPIPPLKFVSLQGEPITSDDLLSPGPRFSWTPDWGRLPLRRRYP